MALLDKLRRRQTEDVAPSYPANKRMYCIGDIHGRADLLEEMHRSILTDAAGFHGELQALYLGDYIDRGEESRQVVDLLLKQALPEFECIYLMGNHEQSLLDFMINPQAMASWLSYGGLTTLYSYGVGLGRIPGEQDLDTLRTKLEEKLPEAHRRFFENCVYYHAEGAYYFVHAGIRPGVALKDQETQDQLWIRDDFIYSKAHHGAIVVHGHTISEKVEVRPNRIGIDTGAFRTGVLTALVLEGSEQRLLQTGKGGV